MQPPVTLRGWPCRRIPAALTHDRRSTAMSIMDTFKIVKTNKFGKDQSRVLTLDFNSVRGRMRSELACCSAAHSACRPALAGLEA